MNNIELQEKLGRRLLKEVAYNCSISDKLNQQSLTEEVAGEYSLEGGIGQFLKDALKFLTKIKSLKHDQEIIIDIVEPTGFITVYNNHGTYELSVAIVGDKTRTFTSKNAGQVIGKCISIFKDQLIRGRKEYKAKYGK